MNNLRRLPPVSLTLLSLPWTRQYISQLSVHLVTRCLDCTSWHILTSVSSECSEVRDSRGWFELRERKTVRDSGVFEIGHSKWLKKQGKIQGKSYSVRDSGEFEITEFWIAGFNCMLNQSLHWSIIITFIFRSVGKGMFLDSWFLINYYILSTTDSDCTQNYCW